MAWVEGLTRSNRILRDLAFVACAANKDQNGDLLLGKNWQLVFPDPTPLAGEKPALGVRLYPVDTSYLTYRARYPYRRWVSTAAVTVYLNGGAVDPSLYSVNHADGSITFNTPNAATDVVTADFTYVSDGLVEALDTVADRVILKTTTTPVDVAGSGGEYVFDPDAGTTQLTMYLEMKKPERLVNPETGLESYRSVTGVLLTTDLNHHYVLVRLSDGWDPVAQRFPDAAHVTDWAKLAWYRDWVEVAKDEIDADPGTLELSEGMLLQQTKISGLHGEVPIQFWAQVDNDHWAMMIMGDPSLSYADYLAGFAYFGRLDSFDEAPADVAGNFAMTVSSSTIPAYLGTPPSGKPTVGVNSATESAQLSGMTAYNLAHPVHVVDGRPQITVISSDGLTTYSLGTDYELIAQGTTPNKAIRRIASGAIPDGAQVTIQYLWRGFAIQESGRGGALPDYHWIAYVVTYLTAAGDESPPSEPLYGWFDAPTNYGQNADPLWTLGFSITFPSDAVGYRVYRAVHYDHGYGFSPSAWANAMGNYRLVAESTSSLISQFTDDGSLTTGTEQPALQGRPVRGVVRDPSSGAVVSVRFSTRWGEQTATGVTDIALYKTKSGMYYQRHYLSLVSPDETLPKDAFQPSSWTGKVHLSPMYVIHGYDGYRGMLKDVLACDPSSLVHLDELIVDKDKPTQKTYKFFRLNAPYHCLSSTSAPYYGVAIRKA